MEILEEGAQYKALNTEKRTPDGEKLWKTIYRVIYEKDFDETKVKSQKYFITKGKSEFNVPQLLPLKINKRVQQVGIEYDFSKNCEG